jgi:hypothetical protein
MKLKETQIPGAGVSRNGRCKVGTLTSLDVVLSTAEIRALIQELERLKCEGRTKTGYHIHLWDSDAEDRDRIEVGLFHEKGYGRHTLSQAIILDRKKRGLKRARR